AEDTGATGSDYIASTTSLVAVGAGTAARLQVILPGEVNQPGNADLPECINTHSPYGKTSGSSPDTQTAGVEFTITVNVTDAYWNIRAAEPDVVIDPGVITSDPFDVDPGTITISGGSSTQTVLMYTAVPSTIAVNHTLQWADNTSTVFNIDANAETNLRILVPGMMREPGDIANNGRSGSPTDQVAGTPFTVTVDAVDSWWNLNAGSTQTITIDTTDTNDTEPVDQELVGGTTNFVITMLTSGFQRVSSSDTAIVMPLVSDTSEDIDVKVGVPKKLQILPPGVAAVPGSASGDDGAEPTPQTAGVNFWVTVNLCDDNWNVVPDGEDPVVKIISNDDYVDDNGLEVSTVALVNGTKSIGVTLVTARDDITELTVSDYDYDKIMPQRIPPYITHVSDAIDVSANNPVKLRVLVPGMIPDLGELTDGKSGTPELQTAGDTFKATIYACDDYWNIADSTEMVHVEVEDPYAVSIPTGQLYGFTGRTVDVNCKQAGDWELTVTDADTSNGILTSQISDQFTVASSTLTRFIVLLPGESHAPGSSTGKTGTASDRSAGVQFDIEVRATDDYFNLVSTNTLISITSTDSQAEYPSDNTLTGGVANFSITLKTTMVGGVDDNNYIFADEVGSYGLVRGTSTEIALNPADCNYLDVTGISDSAAGTASDVTVTARDEFGNVADGGTLRGQTGDNCYATEIVFSADEDPAWDGSKEIPGSGLPSNYIFTTTNEARGGIPGVATFINGVSLRRSGTRVVRVEDIDFSYNNIFGEQTNITVLSGPVAKFTVYPLNDEDIPAGNVREISAYATDDYSNRTTVDATGLDVTVSTSSIVFHDLTRKGETNDGSTINPEHLITDSSGTISGISYTVSRYADDVAVVQVVADTKTISGNPLDGESAEITTIGGSTDYLEFESGDTEFIAGNIPNLADPYIIRRRDIYGNYAETGVTIIDITTDSGSQETTVTSVKPRHMFEDDTRTPLELHNGKRSVTIDEGGIEAKFYYYEQKASWDEVTPDTWTITIDVGLTGGADVDLFAVTVDPADISMITFITPERTLQAGTTSQVMTINTQDEYGNDKRVNETETLSLASESSWCSFITNQGTYTYVGGFWTPLAPPEIVISTGLYSADFYYSDNVRGTPRIDVKGPSDESWGTGQQDAIVVPAPIDHLAFINAPYTTSNPLEAGATSWLIQVQTQDKFDNFAEVDATEEINLFLNYSGGIGADGTIYDFSESDSVWVEIDEVFIATNTSTADLYMKIYKSGTWDIRGERASGGWTQAIQETIVRGGQITQVVFVTPERNVTIEYDDYTTYGSTNYIMTIQVQDKFGNISDVTEKVDLNLYTSVGSDPDFSVDGVNWLTNIISISSGNYETSFYYKDEIKGAHTVYVNEVFNMGTGYPPVDWTPAAQLANVYPSDVDSFLVTHDGLASVYVPEAINIKAVDLYGNFVDGHPDPYFPYGSTDTWVYYVNTASITPSAVGHPAGKEPTVNVSNNMYDFQTALDEGHPGEVEILVTDTIVSDLPDVPYLRISVEDNTDNSIAGLSEELPVAGAIIKPYEDPMSGDRVAPQRIYQDQTNVLMEKISIKTAPDEVSWSTATWYQMRVELEGNVTERTDPVLGIPRVRLWKDNPVAGNVGGFDEPDIGDPDNLGLTSVDILLSSAAFEDNAGRYWTVMDVEDSGVVGTPQTINTTPQIYFITVDCDRYAEPGTQESPTYCNLYWEKQYFNASGYWSPGGAQVSENNFNIETPSVTIKTTPGDIIVYSYPILDSTATVTQGELLGFLRMDMCTDKYTIDWTDLYLELFGYDGFGDDDITDIRVYRDLNADKIFQPAADELISVGNDQFGLETYGSGVPNLAMIKLRNPANLSEYRPQTIEESTQTYFVSMTIDASATIDAKMGINIGSPLMVRAEIEGTNYVAMYHDKNTNLVQDLPDEPDLFPVVTSTHAVIPTIDELQISPDMSLGGVTQGDENKVFSVLSMAADANSIIWKGVKIDKTGTLPDEWVEAVKVWYYVSGSSDAAGKPVVSTSSDSPTGYQDILISEGHDVFVSSVAIINFPEENWDKTDIRTTSKVYLVTMDIDSFAPEGMGVGLNISTAGYFNLAWPDITSAAELPVAIPPKTVAPYRDTVELLTLDATHLIADNQINQSDKNLPIIELRMMTDLSYAWWVDDIEETQPALTIFNYGTALDSEIDSIKLWHDADGNGLFNVVLDTQIAGYPIGSTETLTNGTCEINISTENAQMIINGVVNRKNYFITMDINDNAEPGHTLDIGIESPVNFTLLSPDVLDGSGLPFNTGDKEIIASPRIVSVIPTLGSAVSAEQGDPNILMERLEMFCDGYKVGWTKLLVFRTGNAAAKDEDVSAVKLYRDVANIGTFDWALDALVSSGTFVDGSVTLDYAVNFETVTTSHNYWYLVYDIAPDATPGAEVAAWIGHQSFFTVLQPHSVDGSNIPFESNYVEVLATSDDMSVTASATGVGEVTQGDTSVAVAELYLEADDNSVIWTGVDLHHLGSGNDDDAESIIIFRESNGMGGCQTVDFSTSIVADEKVSYGTEVFIDGLCQLRFDEEMYQSVLPSGSLYYIVFNIAPLAQVDETLGVRIFGPQDFYVQQAADTVSMSGSFDTPLALIDEYADTVTVTPYRIENLPPTPVNVVQGETDVVIDMVQIHTRTPKTGDPESDAPFTGIRVVLDGDLDPEDIAAVKVYYDAFPNGILELDKDMLISSGNDQFDATGGVNVSFTSAWTDNSAYNIGTANKTFFIVYDFAVNATPIRTAGAKFNNSSFFFISQPNIMAQYWDTDQNGAQGGNEPDIYPFQSGLTTVKTMQISFDTEDTAPAGARQGDDAVCMAELKVRVSSNTPSGADSDPTLEYIRVIKKDLYGKTLDADVSSVDVYYDNDGNGQLDTSIDILTSLGVDKFSSGVAIVNLSSYNVIGIQEKTFFLTVDIAENAKVGNFLGISIEGNDNLSINIIPSQRVIEQSGSPFFDSSWTIIRHANAPTTPVVAVRAWINSNTTVTGSWESHTSAARGIINSHFRAGGLSSAGSQMYSQWDAAGAGTQATASVETLTMEHGLVYQFQVYSETADEYGSVHYSDVGYAEFRVDLNNPTSPGAPIPQQFTQDKVLTTYNINWAPAEDNYSSIESGIAQYELQEKKNTSPVWKTVTFLSSAERTHIFKDKPAGNFYYYRVRAQDGAGNWGPWSEVSEAAITGLPDKPVSEVSNYPNPARFDRGDQQTMITYILKNDSEVEVSLYDMMGYLVKIWKFSKAEAGGKQGVNSFPWFGKNENELNVAKGGYILRIKVKSPEGTVEQIRKIGIVR
ncbi:MAG: hypothetical protein GY861_10645, partial [bacterium]|nr:hypothetical protein [bacterium]